MIDRGLVGKTYPSFAVTISEEWLKEWYDLFSRASGEPVSATQLPHNWPAILTAHGTACLFNTWEDLGVDPLELRLTAEEFEHIAAPAAGEEIVGRLRIQEISESVEPETGIEEQLDLIVEFHDRGGRKLAVYTCSYRILRTHSGALSNE